MNLLEAVAANARRFGFTKDTGFHPEEELEFCQKRMIQVIVCGSEEYPSLLSSIFDPPEVLYVRGRLSSSRTLAIVGSRRPTAYGRRTARSFAADAAKAGLVTVSGFARGIDTEVCQASLEAGGQTWAVFGCGLGLCYPPENERLIPEVLDKGGAIVSEVPVFGRPDRDHFPRRNRIISGLSWGTVVVEGDSHSGSLITARQSLEQGRSVFAVPGPIDSSMSDGPNELIREGACAVRGVKDVFDELPNLDPILREAAESGIQPQCPTTEGQKVLQLIGSDTVPLEHLLRDTGWEVEQLTRVLMELQIQGRVDACPGQNYARR